MASSFKLDLPPLPPSRAGPPVEAGRGAGPTGCGNDAGAGAGPRVVAGAAADSSDGGGYRGGGGGGGKLRVVRRGSSSKKTPYDRPASSRQGAAQAPSASSSTSMTSRLVGSASRLITSSASYFFSSLFGGRKPPAIFNGSAISEPKVSTESLEKGLTQSAAQEITASTAKDPPRSSGQNVVAESAIKQADKLVVAPEPSLALADFNSVGPEKKELDLAQLEEMLKQQTWSREQVNRLTGILQARVSDTTVVGTLTTTTTINTQATHVVDDNTTAPLSEAQRWREELKKARADLTPVEVARAYMGERASLPSGLAASFRGSAHQIDRVAELQPPPGLGLSEDRFRSSPVIRTWARSPASVRVSSRSSALDEDWMSVGPIRRTRQRSIPWANSSPSPYSRRLTGESLPQLFASPPIQSSQTARKILDTLEKLTPSPKGKSPQDEAKVDVEKQPAEMIPDVTPLLTRKKVQFTELSRFSRNNESSLSNGVVSPKVSTLIDMGKSTEQRTTMISGFPTAKEPKVEEGGRAPKTAGLFASLDDASQLSSSSASKPPPLSTLNGSLLFSTPSSLFPPMGSSGRHLSTSVASGSALSEERSASMLYSTAVTERTVVASKTSPIEILAASRPESATTSKAVSVSEQAALFSPASKTYAGSRTVTTSSGDGEGGLFKVTESGKKSEETMIGGPKWALGSPAVPSLRSASTGAASEQSVTSFSFGTGSALFPSATGGSLFPVQDSGQPAPPTSSPFSFAKASNASSALTSSGLGSFSALSSGTSSSTSAFSFGAPSKSSMSGPSLFGFGGPLTVLGMSHTEGAGSTLGSSQMSVTSTHSFGGSAIPSESVSSCAAAGLTSVNSFTSSEINASTAANSTPVFPFTAPSAEPKFPTFDFGSNSTFSPPTFTFGSSPSAGALMTTASLPAVSFGFNAASSSPPTLPFGATASPSPFGFGSTSATFSPPAFSFGPTAASSSQLSFSAGSNSSQSSSPSFAFGANATFTSNAASSFVASDTLKSSTTFSFGSQAATSPLVVSPFSSSTASPVLSSQTGVVSPEQPSELGTGASLASLSSTVSNVTSQAGADKSGRKFIKVKRRK